MQTLPIAAIDTNALLRDRTTLESEAMLELTHSIALTGLRQPIEVWPLATPRGPHLYGLISGFRRLTACTQLGMTEIPAFLRSPTSIPEAMALMVAENAIRADLSPWEKVRVLVAARDEGLFDTVDAAVKALHPAASVTTLSRLRGIAPVIEALEGALTAPETLSFRQLGRLSNALRAGFEPVIRSVLLDHADRSPGAQWSRLALTLDEADASLRDPDPLIRPGRPKRLIRPFPGLTVRRERTQSGWTLHFTGREAEGFMIERVMDEIERLYGPP